MDSRRRSRAVGDALRALTSPALLIFVLAAPSGAIQEITSENPVAAVVALIGTSHVDPEAARRLEWLLLDLESRLLDQERPGIDLVEAIVTGAQYLRSSCLPAAQRELDDVACLDLAEYAARAHPVPEQRSNLLASVAQSRGNDLANAGRMQEALECLEAAIALEPAPDRMLPVLLIDAGEVLRAQGRWDLSAACLKRAVEALGDEPRDPVIALRVEQYWMRLELDLGRIDLAWNHREEARRLADRLQPYDRHVYILEEIVFLLACGDLEGAAARAHELSEDQSLAPELMPLALARRGVARLMLARAKGNADPLAAQDLEAALEGGLKGTEASMLRLRLAEEALVRGVPERAQEWLDAVAELASNTGEQQIDTLQRALWCALTARTGRALAVGEPLATRHHEQLQRAARALLGKWGSIEARPGGVGFLHFGARTEALGELVTSELALQGSPKGAAAGLAHFLEAHAQGSFARAWKLPPTTLEQLHSALPAGRLLLAYLFAPHTSYVFAIEKDRVEAYPLESCWTLQGAIDEFAGRFNSPPSRRSERVRAAYAKGTARLARDLCDRLLPNELLERVLAADGLTVSGSELLGVLPFEALALPNGKWLGSHVALDHWPSIPVGLALLERQPSESGSVLAFAAPAHDNRRGAPIEFSKAEESTWLDAWPDLELWSGEQASERRLRASDLESASAALFLAHGTRDDTRPLPMGLALAGTDVLWAEEVAQLSSPALVVLGACGAARGPQRLGEDGSTHFGGAWLAAGASCVVLSPFALEERSTVRSIAELGRGIKAGLTTAEAMRDARARLAAKGAEPYYHQLLRIVGHGH